MAILAVVFDIGGVLERVDDPDEAIGRKWRVRLGLSDDEYAAAIRSVDPDQRNQIGQITPTTIAAVNAVLAEFQGSG